MRLETVRIVADWLHDDGLGVAAKLATLPLDAGDVRPITIPPTSILDETRHLAAAWRRFEGVALPALMVTGVEVRHLDPEIVQINAYADAEVTIQVRYAERSVTAATMQHGDYVIRAVIASLRELHMNAQADARTRNSVQLVSCLDLVEQGIYEEVDDAWLVAAVQVRYLVRTLTPMGA